MQYGDWQHVAGVLAVFGIGQVIESYWLTPKLVGDRIGLHPVAVIFAVLAGGQLFGFLGMLLALPVAAVANVLLRYASSATRTAACTPANSRRCRGCARTVQANRPRSTRARARARRSGRPE